jgi:hypothetical protein
MKKSVLIIVSCLVFGTIQSQDFKDFYRSGVCLYAYYSRITSDAPAYTHPNNTTDNYFQDFRQAPSINLRIEAYKEEKGKFVWDSQTCLGDFMVHMISTGIYKKKHDPDFTGKPKLWAPFITPAVEANLGINLIANEKSILATSGAIGILVIHVLDDMVPDEAEYKGALTIGPTIRYEHMLTDNLAIRIKGSYHYPLIISERARNPKPIIFEINPEIIASWGLYIGVRMFNILNIKSNDANYDNFKATKTDVILGFRFKR